MTTPLNSIDYRNNELDEVGFCFFQRMASERGKELTKEDMREIRQNLMRFFSILAEWARADCDKKATSDMSSRRE